MRPKIQTEKDPILLKNRPNKDQKSDPRKAPINHLTPDYQGPMIKDIHNLALLKSNSYI
jgi:hypothetical protein